MSRTLALVVATLLFGFVQSSPVAAQEGEVCDGREPTIVGTSGPDDIDGTVEADVIVAGDGDDEIDGLAGDDTICAGPGNDLVDGRSGDDVLQGGPGDDVMDGGGGVDDLLGEDGDDKIYGHFFGDDFDADTFEGGDGGDVLIGNKSDDVLNGGPGDDGLFGFGGVDDVSGGPGYDYLEGNAGLDHLSGGDDGDWIADLTGEPIDGGPGSDAAVFFDARQGVEGNLADDQVTVGSVTIELQGVEGLVGSRFDDVLIGDEDANELYGNFGEDRMAGGGGVDVLEATLDRDVVKGGPGLDFVAYIWQIEPGHTVNLKEGKASLNACRGCPSDDDKLSGIEGVYGSEDEDILIGDAGDNLFFPNCGNDNIKGGAGVDIVSYALGDFPVSANLVKGTGGDGKRQCRYSSASGRYGEGSDTFASIEGFIGSAQDDVLIGDGTNNALRGGAGNDTLRAKAGNDYLEGGLGDDLIDGGPGAYDLADHSEAASPIEADLSSGTASGEGSDILEAIEALRGGSLADHLLGDGFANFLFGALGDDAIDGGLGDDGLDGGDGSDELTGGDGTDTCSAGETINSCEGAEAPLAHPYILLSEGTAAASARLQQFEETYKRNNQKRHTG